MRQDFDDALHGILTETVSLHKSDGRVVDNIRCRFASNGERMIFLISDGHLPIEVGDKLVRVLPSGLLEAFVVEDPVHAAGIHGLPAHFQVKVHRAGADRSVPDSAVEGGMAGTLEAPRPRQVRPKPSPPPPISLGGISQPPMLSIRTPRIAYDYPADFPQSARANVFDAEMRAGQVLDEKKSSIRYQADADALLLEFVLPVFATFAEAACNLGMQGTYSRKSVESECYKFLQHLAIEARLTSRGEIRDDVQSNLERSDEWEKYRQLLRRVADSQVGGAPAKGSKPVAKAARAADVKKARAETVGKLIKELDNIKPQMLEDDKEYRRLRTQYPDYLSFKIAEKRPDLKAKILAIRGSARHIRLAQELAAAHYGRELSTIEHDWKDHKPSAFKRRK